MGDSPEALLIRPLRQPLARDWLRHTVWALALLVLSLAFTAFLVVGIVRSLEFQDRYEHFHRLRTTMPGSNDPGDPKRARARAKWLAQMESKYRFAAWLPWLPVEADPPDPGSISQGNPP